MPDGWQQGRGAWGGLVVGAMTGAVIACEKDPSRRLRTISLSLMAPALAGLHAIDVQPLRIGSAMSTWAARLTAQDGTPVATMTAVCGAARAEVTPDQGEWGVLVAPDVPAPEAVPTIRGGAPMPAFTQHLTVGPVDGLPLAGGRTESLGWVDYADPTALDAPAVLALVDAWWPASLVALPTIPRIATVSFTATLLVDPQAEPMAGPLIHHGFVSAAAGGYTSEHRRLWTADGRLVVDNLQTIVVGS